MNWHELVLAAIAMTAGFARGIHEGMAMISISTQRVRQSPYRPSHQIQN